jgi:hypothetical protein
VPIEGDQWTINGRSMGDQWEGGSKISPIKKGIRCLPHHILHCESQVENIFELKLQMNITKFWRIPSLSDKKRCVASSVVKMGNEREIVLPTFILHLDPTIRVNVRFPFVKKVMSPKDLDQVLLLCPFLPFDQARFQWNTEYHAMSLLLLPLRIHHKPPISNRKQKRNRPMRNKKPIDP